MTLPPKWRAFAAALASVALLAWCVWFVWKDDSLGQALQQGRPLGLLATSVCMLVFLWSNGLLLNVMIRGAKVRLQGFESFHLSVVTNAGNSFLPLSAGMALRALYLKNRHGVSLSSFVGALFGFYVVNFLVVFCAGALVMAVLWAAGEPRVIPLFFAFLGAAVSLGLLAAFPSAAGYLPKAILRRVGPVLSGWNALLTEKRALRDLFCLAFLNIVLSSLLMASSFYTVGVSLDAPTALSLSVVNSLALFLKITPGNLGVNELLLVGGGSLVSLEPGMVIMASAVSRVCQYATLLLLLPLSLIGLFGAGWRQALSVVLKKTKTDTML